MGVSLNSCLLKDGKKWPHSAEPLLNTSCIPDAVGYCRDTGSAARSLPRARMLLFQMIAHR